MTVRIAHVLTSTESLTFFEGLFERMHDAGFEVHVLAPEGPLPEAKGRGAPFFHPLAMRRNIAPMSDLAAVVHLAREISKIQPAIVHAHMSKGGLLGMLAATVARVPVRIYHTHGMALFASTGARRAMLWSAERLACNRATVVLSVSRSVREAATAAGVCPPEKIRVLGPGTFNGISARYSAPTVKEERRRLRASLGIPDDAPVAGFVGRLAPQKDLSFLLDAWQRVKGELPEAHLIIVGGDDAIWPLSGRERSRLENTPGVHAVGRQADTVPWYRCMDVLLLPSRWEGFGMVVLEAAGAGIPAVGMAIPGTSDAIVDGQTGSLVTPDDVAAFAATTARYLREPELRRERGAKARARVLAEFGQERVQELLLQEYRRLLQEAKLKAPALSGVG